MNLESNPSPENGDPIRNALFVHAGGSKEQSGASVDKRARWTEYLDLSRFLPSTLVAEHGGRLAEWDRVGKIVWQYSGLRHALSAERLSNGNTLIACLADVREVDRQGKIIWQKKVTGVYHAIRY